MIVAAMLLALAAAAADGKSQEGEKRIQVDGRAFTVEVKGSQAYVRPLYGVLRGHSMDAHGVKLARAAAERASGCRTASSRTTPGGLLAKLDCAAAQEPAR